MKLIHAPFIFSKRNFSNYNFFISIRKGGESTLKNDIKYIYVKDLIKYEKEKKKIDGEKKVKHLIKLNKTNGGIQLKCSTSLIYLLSLKCKYVESIWLNLSKNKICNSLNCLENILFHIEWDAFLHHNDLINIPLKIICINSKLFDILSIKSTIYKCLNIIINKNKNSIQNINNSVIDINNLEDDKIDVTGINNDLNENFFNIDKDNLYNENNLKKKNIHSDNYLDNLNNVWNLLSVHIENNICNIDLKFTGKLSPRFYEYGIIKELEGIKNIKKYENINFFSLFNNNYKINDERIKNIVNENVPFWSICEEKKKIQIDHHNAELNTRENYYKYNFFSNKSRKEEIPDSSYDNNVLLSSPIKIEEGINKNYTLSIKENKQKFSISDEKKGELEEEKEEEALNNLLENENKELKKNISNKMNIDKFKEKFSFSDNSDNIINKKIIDNVKEKEKLEKTNGLDRDYIIYYLKNMEIKRMNYYNNNFFLSDDCYDSSSCIYSLIIQKCLKNKKEINVIWDPFCNSGNLIFELLFYFLNLPLYNEKEILPFMNLKIFNKEEFMNIYNFVLNDLNNNYKKIYLIGSDSRNIMITQCKKNLVRYALYYKDILKKVKLNNNEEAWNRNAIFHSNKIKRNSFLNNVLKEDIGEDEEEEMENSNENFYDEKSDINFIKDLDQLYDMEKDQKKKNNKGIKNEGVKNEEKIKKKETKSEEIDIKIPDIETISISTEEDKKYNLNFPFNISFHKTHFFNIAPFIKNGIIITKIPHFSFSKELGISKKTFTLYEQFDQMLCSKNDWLGVYVLIRNKVFLNKSKLEWNKILSINDSKGRCLTLLSWSGRTKSLYSLSTENDRLKELEKFSENLRFDT